MNYFVLIFLFLFFRGFFCFFFAFFCLGLFLFGFVLTKTSRASEIEHFEIFSRPRKNQLARQSAGLHFCYSLFFLVNPLEAVVWMCSAKKGVFKNSENLYQKTCACGLKLYLKRDSVTGV